jgi:plastocyanin
MKRMQILRLYFGLLAAFAWALVAHAQEPKTFTVLVGAEDASVSATVDAFFPDTLLIHVGDTVHWKRNANDIHTVSFLAGTPIPDLIIPAPSGLPSPVMFNSVAALPTAPDQGQYDGTSFANSGIIGPDPGQVESFDLSFNKPGTYNYVCLVHGITMSGKIIVLDYPAEIPTPREVKQEAKRSVAAALAQIPVAVALANAEIPVPTRNPDGTTTFYVLVGFSVGQLDLVRFFPDQLTVHPGDTVEWRLNKDEMLAPHTVTFLNGNPEPDAVLPVPQDNGPPLLLFNPDVLLPRNAGQPLTCQGIYSAGLLQQNPVGPTSFAFQIGDTSGLLPYECLLHDSSGMKGVLEVVPRP